MSWRTAFAPLLRALTGGRFPVGTTEPGVRSFDPLMDVLLAELKLPPGAFADLLAARSLHPHFHYHCFTRAKKGGGRRHIAEPDAKLKQVQKAILSYYLQKEQPHPAAIAFRRKMSIADHVWTHAGADVLVTADVRDFFPNTREDRVLDWWSVRVEGELARLLTLLTTWRGGLPQGAPTSPALSNLVNHDLDERLACRALAVGARYTRYCDDMVFSWRHGDGPPSDFQNAIRSALNEAGYALHPEKGWRVYQRRDEPEITGVILTRRGHVRLPDHLRQVMRSLARSSDPYDAERLAGYQGYEAMVATPRKPKPRARARARTPTRSDRSTSGVVFGVPSQGANPADSGDDIPF